MQLHGRKEKTQHMWVDCWSMCSVDEFLSFFSRTHDWLHGTCWQIHPTHAEIFLSQQRNNHTWCHCKQLISINIYVFLRCDDLRGAAVAVIRIKRCCNSHQSGFDGWHKHMLIEIDHNCITTGMAASLWILSVILVCICMCIFRGGFENNVTMHAKSSQVHCQ